MTNSIVIEKVTIDAIKETGFHTWLNFWLNVQAHGPARFEYIDTDGNRAELSGAPFSLRNLELLVIEEFKMILEHLSCKKYSDFEKLMEGKSGSAGTRQPLEVYARTKENYIILRTYYFDEAALLRLGALFKNESAHLTWDENRSSE